MPIFCSLTHIHKYVYRSSLVCKYLINDQETIILKQFNFLLSVSKL